MNQFNFHVCLVALEDFLFPSAGTLFTVKFIWVSSRYF